MLATVFQATLDRTGINPAVSLSCSLFSLLSIPDPCAPWIIWLSKVKV